MIAAQHRAVEELLRSKTGEEMEVGELREVFRVVWPSTIADFCRRYSVDDSSMSKFLNGTAGRDTPTCAPARALRRFVGELRAMQAQPADEIPPPPPPPAAVSSSAAERRRKSHGDAAPSSSSSSKATPTTSAAAAVSGIPPPSKPPMALAERRRSSAAAAGAGEQHKPPRKADAAAAAAAKEQALEQEVARLQVRTAELELKLRGATLEAQRLREALAARSPRGGADDSGSALRSMLSRSEDERQRAEASASRADAELLRMRRVLRDTEMRAEQEAAETRRFCDSLVVQANQLRQQLELQRASTPSRGAAICLGLSAGIVAFCLAALTAVFTF